MARISTGFLTNIIDKRCGISFLYVPGQSLSKHLQLDTNWLNYISIWWKKNWITCTWYTSKSLQEKWVFFAKDNRILHPGNRELYLYHRADCSTLSDQQGHAVSNRGTLCRDKFCLSHCWCKLWSSVNFDNVTWYEIKPLSNARISILWVGCPCFEGSTHG